MILFLFYRLPIRIIRAFEETLLIPTDHADNANKLVSMRDENGSIRISDCGNVPIAGADMRRERQLLESRHKGSGKTYRHMLTDINMMV